MPRYRKHRHQIPETHRRKCKGQMTPQGNPMPYTELSQEVYETLSDNEKSKYHQFSEILDDLHPNGSRPSKISTDAWPI